MQSLLGPAKLEGLLKSPSDVLVPDLEPASPFANMNAVATFWKGKRSIKYRRTMSENPAERLGLHAFCTACRV